MATLNKRYTVVKDAGLKIQAMVAVRSRPGAPGGTGGRGLEVPKNASPAAADHPGRALRGWIPHAVSAVCVRGVIAPCPAHDGCAQGHHSLRVQRSSSPGETPREGEGRVRGCGVRGGRAREHARAWGPACRCGARPAAAGPVRSLRTCRAARSAGQPSGQQRPRRPVARVPGSPAGAPNGAGGSRHPTHGAVVFYPA